MKNLSKMAMVLAAGVLSTSLAFVTDIKSSTAQTCNPFGCSQPGAGACNPFGCPNPGANPCTPFGCPPSPAGYGSNKPQQTTPIIVMPNNSGNGNSGMGECMDRLMYREIRATSGPDSSGYYSFSQPQGVAADDMRAAGLVNRSFGSGWGGRQSVVKIQVMDGRTAASSCR
jgi:hypothetical protein